MVLSAREITAERFTVRSAYRVGALYKSRARSVATYAYQLDEKRAIMSISLSLR